SSGDEGIAVSCATGRPRSLIVTVSPATAAATTAEAFCFSARVPTSDMCYSVALTGAVGQSEGIDPRPPPRHQREARNSGPSGTVTRTPLLSATASAAPGPPHHPRHEVLPMTTVPALSLIDGTTIPQVGYGVLMIP